MKKIARYVLTVAMMLASAIGAQAQSDPDATIKAVEKIIENHKENAEHFISNEIYPKYRKDAKVLTGIARAYNQKSRVDSSYIFNYVRKALDVNSKYAPAYIVGGNEFKANKDTIAAFEWYDRAIKADPQDPEGYRSYAKLLAKTNPEGAVNKLKEILNVVPDYEVYIEAAHIYDDNNDFAKVIDCYDNANKSKMTAADFVTYVTYLRVGRYLSKADSVLVVANQMYPSNGELNRLALRTSLDLEKYNHALEMADALFNKSDSVNIGQADYNYYGLSLMGNRRYNDAISMFQKCIDYENLRKDFKSDDLFENAKRQENRYKWEAMAQIAVAQDSLVFPDKAVEQQKEYIAFKKEQGKLEAIDVYTLAKYYEHLADIEFGESKINAYKNSYDAYLEIVEVTPEHATLAYYYRIQTAWLYLDPEMDNGLAVPDAEKIVELISITEDMKSTDKGRLMYALGYLIRYNLKKNQYKPLGKYWKMLGRLDSDHQLYLLLDNPTYRRKMGIR